ncbi:MAG TPA: helicase-related protein [Candidatus Baltobacteraceae bacterium]|nr:helicase-related protein [Candidatus Baltobacteraceae bacterium]
MASASEAMDGDKNLQGRLSDVEAFVTSAFANQKAYLARDPFAGIGDRDVFVTKVMGVSFEGRQNMVAGLLPGGELDLKRQPDNQYDPNAIAVYFGTFHIGYLRKEIAKHVAPLIDGGAHYRAVIEHVTGPSGGSEPAQEEKFRGVNIRVERVVATARDPFAVQARGAADADAVRAALIGSSQPHDAQQAVLARLQSGKNTLAIFGTGRGKSFCFQYPAALRALESEQKTLILYPLRALANDQFDALTRRLDAFGLRIHRANGSISTEERAALMDALGRGDWDIVLATPEFLQFHREAFTGRSAPSLVVVDESHHIFESKHRAAYGRLGATIESLGQPQVLALTATADSEAFAQITADLKIAAWVIDPTVRENLHVVDSRGMRDKLSHLADLFRDSGGKGIVYCNSRSEATKTAEGLRKTFPNEVMFYHAGMPTAERTQVEQYFRAGDLRIIVATSAFGEGIDLPDVRDVVLYHLNFDFTEFNQQAGRAGRDGGEARIHLLFGEGDRRINEFIIDRQAPTLNVLRALYKGMRHIAAGGMLRMTFVDIARTLELDKADERTVSAAVRIFEDEGLVETGVDDDGRFVRFLPVDGKVDMTQNERFAEGEAAREDFAKFSDFVLSAKAETLERIINRPIYPERVDLRR